MVPKFRAWDKENNRMIYPSTNDVYFELTDDGLNVLDMSIEPYDDVFPHLDSIVMQSTGLKDKNDVEVFRGDIVRCSRGCPHEVILLKEYAGMYVGGMPAWYLSGLSEGYAWSGEEEVIGNIYEKPELLEVQDDSN